MQLKGAGFLCLLFVLMLTLRASPRRVIRW